MQDVKNSGWCFLQALQANSGTASIHHHLLLLLRISLVGMVLRHRTTLHYNSHFINTFLL